MASIQIIKVWKDATSYLENLKKTIISDIKPLLDTAGYAPFAVSREVLSYVDHLGHLYSGKGKVGERAEDYLKQVLSQTDPNYGNRASEIYQMYRCGPVHEFEPKILENKKGQLLRWLCYKGSRSAVIELEKQMISIKHLEPVCSLDIRYFWLPVSTNCLVEDLIDSIDKFKSAGPEDERTTAWNRAARELNYPKPFEFTIP